MKKFLLSLGLIAGLQSFATDEVVAVYRCDVKQNNQLSATHVLISEGGFSGITQAVVTQMNEGRLDTHLYFVRHEVDSKSVIYTGTGTRGQVFELSIYPEEVLKDGGMLGNLVLNTGTQVELSCRFAGGEINLDS